MQGAWNICIVLGKPLHTWIHPKYAGINTKSMGKVSEDKTTNHTTPVKKTCAILVTDCHRKGTKSYLGCFYIPFCKTIDAK